MGNMLIDDRQPAFDLRNDVTIMQLPHECAGIHRGTRRELTLNNRFTRFIGCEKPAYLIFGFLRTGVLLQSSKGRAGKDFSGFTGQDYKICYGFVRKPKASRDCENKAAFGYSSFACAIPSENPEL